MPKKYTNGALWRCLKAYPDPEHFKLFMGHCYIMGFTRARFMEDIIRDYFKAFTASQREHLLKKYDECFLQETLEKWPDCRLRLSHERVNYLYSRIRYKKVMRLNIGFNEADYKWSVMFGVFDLIFTGGDEKALGILMQDLPQDLQLNCVEFFNEVKRLKEKRR